MNNENNNQNQDNNIVQPQLVDLSKVTVTNEDNILNRERENIVSATIQANNALDETKAVTVNDQIHIEAGFTKKKKQTIGLIIGILIVGAILVFLLMTKLFSDEEATTTKPIITGAITSLKDRVMNGSKVRRFENDTYVMIFLPAKYNKYMLLNKTNSTYTTGTLSINKDIIVTDANNEQTTITIAENKLVYKDTMLLYSDGEYKYYTSDNAILLINATMGVERALYINNGVEVIDSFVETETNITLTGGLLFTKSNTDLIIDGNTLKMGE